IFLSIIGLAIPTLLAITVFQSDSVNGETKIQLLSDSVAIILIFVYAAAIIFTFVTHRYLFTYTAHSNENNTSTSMEIKHWTKRKSFLILGLSMLGVVVV